MYTNYFKLQQSLQYASLKALVFGECQDPSVDLDFATSNKEPMCNKHICKKDESKKTVAFLEKGG